MTMTTERPQVSAPEEPQGDIYALLGVTPDVTPSLAREVYWLRVEHYREAQANGDPVAADSIEELNHALAIVLDDDRRSAYDRRRQKTTPRPPAVDSGRRLRVGTVLSLMLLTVIATIIAEVQGGALAMAATMSAGMIAVVTVVTWPRREPAAPRGNPFATLRLTPEAGLREVNLAYETIGHEYLSRLKFDPNAIRRLERLDRAYAAALRAIASRDGATGRRQRGFVSRFLIAFARVWFLAARGIVWFLGSVATTVLLWSARSAARVAMAGGRALRFNADRLSTLVQDLQDSPAHEEVPEFSIDLSRRLAIGRRPDVLDDEQSEADAEVAVAEERAPRRAERSIEAYLILESAAGRRRVPIPTAPLSIGSSGECDLVLHAEMGIAPQHALLWQRDGLLILHVTAPRPGACLVNDQPMTWASLEDGDVLMLGDVRFRIEAP